MTIVKRLTDDMKQAMKNKDRLKLSVVQMVRAAIKNAEINARKDLNDEEVLEVISRELKQRRDSLQEFKNAGRADLIETVEAEIAILIDYLPEQLSEEEVHTIVADTVKEVGASSKADMGKVMSALMPRVKGKADGKLVNQIVQQYLN